MTWEQITIACPHCGQPAPVHPGLTHVYLLCHSCGGWFALSSKLDSTGLPVPVKVASPEEVSLTGTGGWKVDKGA